MADRDVVFTGKFVVSPEARKSFEEMGKLASDTQKSMDAAAASAAKTIEAMGKTGAKAGQQITLEFDKTQKAIEGIGSSATKLDNAIVGLRQGVVNAAKQIEEAGKRADASFINTGKVVTTTTQKAIVDFGKLSQANMDLAKAEETRAAVIEANQRRKAEQAAANLRRIYDEANKEVQKQSAIVEMANKRIGDGLTKAGQGAVSFGRGLALVGLAGEKDMQKILEMLIKVQAVVDLTRGGIEIYRGISDAVKAYRTAVIAATAAETALAMARSRTAAAGGAKGIGGAAGGLLPGSVGLGGMGTAAAFAAPVAAAVGVVSAGVMASNIGGSRDYAASKMVRNGWADPGSTLGWMAGASAVGDMVFGGDDPQGGRPETTYDIQQRAVRGRNRLGAADEAIEGSEAQQRFRQNQARDLAKNDERFAIEQSLRNARSVQTQQAAVSQGRERGLSGLDLERFVIGQQQQSAQGQLSLDQANLSRARDGNQGTVMQRQAQGQAQANVNQSLQEAIALTQKRLEIEKAIAAEQKRATSEQIAGIQQAIAMEQQKLDAAKDAISSGEERLGRATEEERRKYVRASQKQQQGGKLSDEELQIVERFGGSEQQAKVAEEFRKRGQKAAQQGGGYEAEKQAAQRARDEQRRQQGFADELGAQQAEEEAAAKRNIGGAQNDLDRLANEQARSEVQTIVDRKVEIKIQGKDVLDNAVAEVGAMIDRASKELAQRMQAEAKAVLDQNLADARARNAGLN